MLITVQIVFTLRAVQYPASMPVSLASLNLLQQSTSQFSFMVWRFFDQTSSITEQLATVRKLYEVANIPNRIKDGTVPFPEDAQKIRNGVALEFRCVLLLAGVCAHWLTWLPQERVLQVPWIGAVRSAGRLVQALCWTALRASPVP